MSERILKALMQLFAIVANVGRDDSNTRAFVRQFLDEQLNADLVEEYLLVYDKFYNEQNKKRDGAKARKRTSLNSVKVLKICAEINKELTQKQKVYVLVQLLEFIYQNNNDTDQAIEFVETVADSFHISGEEYLLTKDFVSAPEGMLPKTEQVLLINNKERTEGEHYHIRANDLNGQVRILQVSSVSMLFMKYFGTTELQLNSQLINPGKTYVLTQGSSLRGSKVAPIYYSDVINSFLSDDTREKTSFSVDKITYKFKNGNTGLHTMTLEEESGNLIGIMGASGAGKSTLLNVLNGNYKPSTGAVKINGFDIHDPSNKDKIEGVIGYVSQDDLLIEELTVFENIYYNAKLCFGDLADRKVIRLVFKVLHSLGLYEIRDLKVGSPLEKTISGGQRKRVNIALELIREPSVLFVDEPTSGLSSRDSENIMDLLKELTLRGKLIFVVIHQPSSEIFKMFDKLIILDTGGYLIYNGNPVDGIVYFKQQMQQANAVESECIQCGNVNPEQIFNIIESKILDEYGNQTDKRRVTPKEWYKKYNHEIKGKTGEKIEINNNPPETNLKIPNGWKQFMVFIKRDVLSKIANKQYLLINFLEAPVLAFILSFIIKYHNTDEANSTDYIFRENENLTAYIFMSVIVAIFLGLTVAAEEIIRDRKILKREKFLNLSRGSYLFSKIAIMFTVSAIQILTFVLVGNSILEIRGMYLEYWLILFSAACFANMLGLNISASFDSAVTIYILIPFLVIPQLILSGVIVKFEKLNPVITIQKKVPLAGEIMASKWAFEALAVNQFKNNKFNKQFYFIDKDIKTASFRKNFWLSRLRDRLNYLERNLGNSSEAEKVAAARTLLYNEISKENARNEVIRFEQLESLRSELDKALLTEVSDYFEELNNYYIESYNVFNDEKDQLLIQLNKTEEDKKAFIKAKDAYTNESLENLVTNKNDLDKIIEWKGELIQRADPIYKDPVGFRAHFLAPSKKLFGIYLTTFSANLLVLWSFSFMLAITLYFDALRKLLSSIAKIFNRKKY
jgi:ABC-type multidrug transport system ATPase subunit